MNLIDCFNIFQDVTKGLKLSANARSLYIAILGEFNSARYPETLGLANRVLQDISGIKSDSSFHSARNALINAGLIAVKKNFYRLTPEAALEKARGCFNEGKESFDTKADDTAKGLVPVSQPKGDKKEPPSEESLSVNSPEVLAAWYDNKGEKLAGAKAFSLICDEKLYGAESVIKAIVTASTSNDYENFHKVTYNYFKKILEGQQKGDTKIGNDTGNIKNIVDNAQYAGVDICPD